MSGPFCYLICHPLALATRFNYLRKPFLDFTPFRSDEVHNHNPIVG